MCICLSVCRRVLSARLFAKVLFGRSCRVPGYVLWCLVRFFCLVGLVFVHSWCSFIFIFFLFFVFGGLFVWLFFHWIVRLFGELVSSVGLLNCARVQVSVRVSTCVATVLFNCGCVWCNNWTSFVHVGVLQRLQQFCVCCNRCNSRCTCAHVSISVICVVLGLRAYLLLLWSLFQRMNHCLLGDWSVCLLSCLFVSLRFCLFVCLLVRLLSCLL